MHSTALVLQNRGRNKFHEPFQRAVAAVHHELPGVGQPKTEHWPPVKRAALMAVINAPISTPRGEDSFDKAYRMHRLRKTVNSLSLIFPIVGCAAEKLFRLSRHWSRKKKPSSVIRFSFKQSSTNSLSCNSSKCLSSKSD